MGRQGFEPWANRLKAECSTAELPTQVCSFIMVAKLSGEIPRNFAMLVSSQPWGCNGFDGVANMGS
jgi:L-serine deaminase